jgi:Leucine-rich repeat (LRR) protein
LVCLTHLNLRWCKSLKELPESIGNLVCLTHLNLSYCGSLEKLPKSMRNLVSLTHLDLTRCASLMKLESEEDNQDSGNLDDGYRVDSDSCSDIEAC